MKEKGNITRRGRSRRQGVKRIFAASLAMVLMLSMAAVSSFAAGANDRPDGSSYEVQTAAGPNGNTAVVTLGKILTCSQPDSFPAVSDFIYTVEAVEGWRNANISTALSGEPVAAADMPRPAAAPGDRAITSSGVTSTVLIGDFQDASAQNHSTGDGPDTSLCRTRTTPVHITFSEAGYYVYKVKETGSVPADVPGVDYDDNEYFMVFYVCNKVDQDGNTDEGVYVHSITSYANTSGSETYKPDLSDIQNVTDNRGAAAGANTGQVNPDGTVTHQTGKVGVSSPEHPNQLEAYRMWNAFVSHDLVIKKNVTGNLGDRTKLFEFTVTLTGLEKGRTYSAGTAQDTGDTATVEIVSASVGTKVSGTSFKADDNGSATILLKMKDEDCFVISGLPMTAQYMVSEAASDHVARYEITSSAEAGGQTGPVIASAAGSNGKVSDRALATGTETVDRYDGTVTVQYTNNRDLATITGVPGLDFMAWGAAAMILMAAVAGLARRRRTDGGSDIQAMEKMAEDRPLD